MMAGISYYKAFSIRIAEHGRGTSKAGYNLLYQNPTNTKY
jgi:hypothetical protein